MARLNLPLQLSPVFKPKIWGREDLSPLFSCAGKPAGARGAPATPGRQRIGEAWITDDESQFLNGPVAGRTLAEVSAELGPELNGRRWSEARFPILGKYIFTSDWLSVQVHPDDEQARVYDPGSPGKCEAWYILRAERGGRILLGARPGVTKDQLRAAFARGASRGLLTEFKPRAGETVFVPPGTIHALGPGLVLFEVEENSDLTYRLDDFGRVGLDGKPRPLHLDKGLDVLRLDAPPLRDLARVEFSEPFGKRRIAAACRYFALEVWTVRRLARLEGNPERVEVFSILEGEGRVENEAGWMRFEPGDTWLIPPEAEAFRLIPHDEVVRLLRFYVPDLDRDLREPLKKKGVKKSKLEKVLFDQEPNGAQSGL
jgi:mannose-6-phosphate isomerase